MKTGIVLRQTFLSSISAYIGVLIGYINALMMMPKYLTPEEIGLMRAIMAIGMLLVPLVLAGTANGLVKFYPKLSDKIPNLNAYTLAMMLVSFTLVLLISYIFQDQWYSIFQKKSPEVNKYFWLVYIMVLMMALFNYLEAISRTQLDIIWPNFFRELIYKSGHMLVIAFVGIGILNFHQYLYSHFFIYIVLIVGLAYVIWRKAPIRFNFRAITKQSFGKELMQFSLFSILGNFGIMMVLQIDQIMVTSFLGLQQAGIYVIAVFMAIVIELPRRLISQITLPIVSKAYHEERFTDINSQYKSASINLLLLGSLLLLLITLNLDTIYTIMPNGENYRAGYWVVFLIGFTKMIDMLFSINGEIISMSKYYRVNVFLILGLGIGTAITNYIFIPVYGIEGAALATLVTYLTFNLTKYILLKKIYRFDPFTFKTFQIIIAMTVGYFLIGLIPAIYHPIVDLIIRSGLIVVYFIVVIWVLKPSDELISLYRKLINKP